MSAERELLKKVIRNMQYLNYSCNKNLRGEIQEILAQPEQEPDLWVVTNPWGVNEYLWSEPREQIYANYKVSKFYRSPQKREPMSDTKCPYPEETSCEYRDGFTDGILYAEKMHGIGVDDE